MPIYQDRVFDPTAIGLTIGNLMAHQGDAAARAAEIIASARSRAAEVRGNAWATAADALGNAPADLQAMKDARIDRQLKQENLAATVDARKSQALTRTAQLTGRTLATTRTPDEAKSAISYLMTNGGIDPEFGKTVLQRIDEAGPDGFEGLKGDYVNFANRFEAITKYGKDEIGVQGTKADGSPNVVARGPAGPPTKEEVALAAGGWQPGQPVTQDMARSALEQERGPQVVGGGGGTVLGPGGAQTVVPPVLKPGEAEEIQGRVALLDRQKQEIDQKLNGTVPMTAKDRAELELQRQHLELTRLSENMRLNREDPASPQNQEKLEQAYRSLAQTVIRSRSGQLGVEDQKVGTAKHLLAMLEQAKNPDGSYDLARVQRRELATGLARLISPTGAIAENQVDQLDQLTAKGDLADFLTYVTGNPKLVNAAPQKIAELFRDSIIRQGRQAEQNREKELDFIRSSRPTDLDPKRAIGIENGLSGLNSIDDVLGGADTTVKMRAPNGDEKDVPVAEVEHYKALGAVVVKK